MKLSENFYLNEFIKSDYALRHTIDNTPTQQVISNLKVLCNKILQPIRDKYGPLIVLSGYRSPILNRAIGGSGTSDHMYGMAADIEVASTSNYDLAVWIKNNLKFKQLILEFYTIGDKHSGWVHVSYDINNLKNQVLTASKENTKTIYRLGLAT